MSNRWPGGLVRKTPVTPTGPYQNSAASGVWTLADASYWKKQSLWPTQGVFQYWLSIQNGSNSQSASRMQVDSSGNIYAVGSITVSNSDFLVVKYNSFGAIVWQKRLGWSTSSSDSGVAIALDSSGNIYVVGQGFSVATIVKLDNNGNLLWQRNLGTVSGSSAFYAVAVDSSGNALAVGYGSNSGTTNAIVVKYDTSGTILWQRYFGGGSYVDVSDAVVDTGDNIIIAATSISGTYKGQLIKYNSSGTLQFQRSFGGSSDDFGRAIGVDSSGNIFIGVQTNVSGSYGQSLVKYNSSGTLQWQRRLDNQGEPRQIRVDTSGNVFLYGYSFPSNKPTSVAVVKYDTSGNVLFQRELGGGFFASNNLNAASIAVDSSNMYFLASTNISGTTKFFLTEFPVDGTGTGTYFLNDNYTYAASSYTSSTSTLTSSTTSFSSSTSSYTNDTPSYSATDTTLTVQQTGF